MLELATLISRHARYRPDASAVVCGDERLTYGQFGARVARVANLLRSIAAIILRAGAQATTEELRVWINDRVAARYQRVSEIIIMNNFPRSAAGKTLKREMRSPYWTGREKNI